jgi:hypothetical protein
MHHNKHKKKQQKPRTEPVFQSKHKPHTKGYAIDLAVHMLKWCKNFTHIKKSTGLSLKRMVQLGLIEYHYPFTKKIANPKAMSIDTAFIEVPDKTMVWLRKRG